MDEPNIKRNMSASPATPIGYQNLYSFSVVETRPIGAEDYFRAHHARLLETRQLNLNKDADVSRTFDDRKSPETNDVSNGRDSSTDGRDPFSGWSHEIVTSVTGNCNLVLTSGHGGTAPIPVDFSVDELLTPNYGPIKGDEGTLDSEEEAAKQFVPFRTKKHLPGFATVIDDNTAQLAEFVFLSLLENLNPGVQIDLTDVSQLHKTDLKVPHLVIARFSRRFCDANRPGPLACEHSAALAAHSYYHGLISRTVSFVRSNFPHGLLLDIHGQSELPSKMLRGTLDGVTVSSLLERHGRSAFDTSPTSLLGRFEGLGLEVFPSGLQPPPLSIIDARVTVKDCQIGMSSHHLAEAPPFQPATKEPMTADTIRESPGYRGGWTVQRYGSHTIEMGDTWRYGSETGKREELVEKRPSGIDALQLEIGKQYRARDGLKETGVKLAEGLAGFYRDYLV
jgi:hypothetical protein